MSNPDTHARGFTDQPVDVSRYGNYESDPLETSGIVESMVPAGSRVLEVGCGNGRLSIFLRDHRSCQTFGIEPHEERAQQARNSGLEVITGYFDRSNATEFGQFDVVLFGDVLEHLVDPLEMLLISREALKPGGIVIVSVPNVAHWTVRLSLARGRFDYEPYGIMDATHLRWFTWKTLEKLFMKAGFELTDRRVSAGTSMKVYHTRTPWRRLSSVKLRRVLGRLSQYFPKMFGCQLVFRGRMVELPSSGDSI